MNKLVETLQTRIAELEKENIELKRDVRRFDNGRLIMLDMIDSLTKKLLEAQKQDTQ